MKDIKSEFKSAVKPVIRLLGHTAAVAIGFSGFALISMVPVGILRLLILMGQAQLVDALHALEHFVLIVDIGLFVVVFLVGVVVFLAEELTKAKCRIKSAQHAGDEDDE